MQLRVAAMPECVDFLEFQEYLKKSRDVDDKLVYMLNTSLPTTSFRSNVDLGSRCQGLYSQLEDNYKHRESSIHHCISEATEHVRKLKSSNDVDAIKNLRREQTKIKLLRTELGVEEVVKDRSLKLFYEKCRSFYKPGNLSL